MDHNPEPEALLTVPDQITNPEKLFLTGNEYLSLPQISPAAGIVSLNVLRLDQRGLLEFSGTEQTPLVEPVISVNESPVETSGGFEWHYQLNWIPEFRLKDDSGSWSVEGEIFAPPGFKGFCWRLKCTNTGKKPLTVNLGWQVAWESFNYIVFNRRPISGSRDIRHDRWTGSLILEGSSGLPLASLALAAEPAGIWNTDPQEGSFSIQNSFYLEPGQEYETRLYGAVNLDADGAGTTSIDLRRHGMKALKEHTEQWLKSKQVSIENETLGPLLNRNLFFCYFYSLACSLDSEDLVPVTSRSPRYYVSSAFWSRDTFLWSFPAVMMVDQDQARDLLVNVYRRHIKNAGDHAHYINGTVLYPGFELDELAAYFIALKHYLDRSEDSSIMEEKVIRDGLDILVDKAFERFDPQSGLYSTFLSPSDDPVTYPYLTYNNALLQRSFHFLSQLQEKELWNHKSDFAILSRELLQAIFDHCIVQGPFGTMFAWAVDGKGRFILYDNPPGSLQLLAWYGFCSIEDTVFKNTVRWIRSFNNKYFHQGSNFEETGSMHAKNPWPMGACNDLLACNAGAVDFLSRVEMDNGFFCESVYPETGQVSTGAAFASGAGLLAWAIKEKVE